ncbi:hypothetical protein [Rhodovibrio salinarum]|nr:hypothetical protein [Rhodovibrio salinarum]
MRLSGNKTIVTGGNTGIGRAVAERFVEQEDRLAEVSASYNANSRRS